VENAGGLGRHLAVRLAAAGESVVDVPPKLSARVRVLSSFAGNARKNDGLDALATALAASRNERLAVVDPEAASEVLRDVRTLDRKIADLSGRIEAEIETSGTTLTQIFGIGPILAARIIGTVGDVARFPTKAHFASYSGTAPLEASSGEVMRHRPSLALKTASLTTPCTWSRYARPDRTPGVAPTTAKRSRRASPARKRCVPQEAHLRCRLQEPSGGFAGTLARRRLTKRSLERRKAEVQRRRIYLPRTQVNSPLLEVR
jgi:hypothetical protein